ncbi:MAG: hypothetical protein ACSLFK_11515 [Gemmatimonadaceae bacterium]
MRHVLLAVAGAVVAACATPSHPGDAGGPSETVQAETGRQFELAVGADAEVAGTPLRIRFLGVGDDSRCPVDVQCVWAGNAVVRLRLTGGRAASDLGLNTGLDPKSASYAGHTVFLSGLAPAPRSGTTIPQASYVATLEVRPSGGG